MNLNGGAQAGIAGGGGGGGRQGGVVGEVQFLLFLEELGQPHAGGEGLAGRGKRRLRAGEQASAQMEI